MIFGKSMGVCFSKLPKNPLYTLSLRFQVYIKKSLCLPVQEKFLFHISIFRYLQNHLTCPNFGGQISTGTTVGLIEKGSLFPGKCWFVARPCFISVNQSNIYLIVHKCKLKNFQDYLGHKVVWFVSKWKDNALLLAAT